MTLREAATQLLAEFEDVLEIADGATKNVDWTGANRAIKAVQQALAQPENKLSDRDVLIAKLRDDSARHADSDRRLCNKAADMLEADARKPSFVRERAQLEQEWCGLQDLKQAQQVAVPQTPNNDEVICPSCCTQFRAIPVNVQRLILDAGFEPPFVAAPQPAYVPLSDAEIEALDCVWLKDLGFDECEVDQASVMRFARAIEQAVRGKT